MNLPNKLTVLRIIMVTVFDFYAYGCRRSGHNNVIASSQFLQLRV